MKCLFERRKKEKREQFVVVASVCVGSIYDIVVWLLLINRKDRGQNHLIGERML